MRRALTIFLLLSCFVGCTPTEPLEPGDLYGRWKFQGYGSHLADVILADPRAVWRDPNAPTLLLERRGDTVHFAGQAPVNTYFGTYRPGPALPAPAVGYRAENRTLGNTEKAGPAAAMEQERQYLDGIGQLKSVAIFRWPSRAYDQLVWMTSENEYLSFIRKR
jgi:hypothetical protein